MSHFTVIDSGSNALDLKPVGLFDRLRDVRRGRLFGSLGPEGVRGALATSIARSALVSINRLTGNQIVMQKLV